MNAFDEGFFGSHSERALWFITGTCVPIQARPKGLYDGLDGLLGTSCAQVEAVPSDNIGLGSDAIYRSSLAKSTLGVNLLRVTWISAELAGGILHFLIFS